MSVDPVSMSAFRDELEKIASRAALKAALKAGRKAADKGPSMFQKSRSTMGHALHEGRKAFRGVKREEAFAKRVARKPGEGKVKHWLRSGWEEAGGPHGGMGGWGGAKDTWREKVPIGGKSLATLGTAAMLPGALKKEDPMSRGRSRLERVSQVGAGTLGGIAGVGAVMRAGGKTGLLRTLAGGMGGALGGEYLASLPFRRARRERMQGGPLSRADRAQMMGQMMPPQQPGGLR